MSSMFGGGGGGSGGGAGTPTTSAPTTSAPSGTGVLSSIQSYLNSPQPGQGNGYGVAQPGPLQSFTQGVYQGFTGSDVGTNNNLSGIIGHALGTVPGGGGLGALSDLVGHSGLKDNGLVQALQRLVGGGGGGAGGIPPINAPGINVQPVKGSLIKVVPYTPNPSAQRGILGSYVGGLTGGIIGAGNGAGG